MAGTGLPIPQSGVLAQSPGVMDGDRLTSAQAWSSIARAGAQLASIGADALERDAHAARAARVADLDVANRAKAIEIEDKYRDNPEGFREAWEGYHAGIIGSVEPGIRTYVHRELGELGNGAFARILERRRSADRVASGEKITALVQASSDELGSIAMRGELGTPAGVEAAEKLKAVLATAVTAGVWTQERADLRFNQATADAQAEGVLYEARGVYASARSSGEDALAVARQFADDRIINNPDLALSPAERRAYSARVTAELGADEALRRQDLSIARKAAQDAQTAMIGGVRVSPETIDGLADQLAANGGQADAARLRAAAARADRMRSYGRLPFNAQVEEAGAAALGLSPDIADRLMGAESGGDPNARNPNSSATGAGQFIDGTWLDLMRRHRPDLAASKSDAEVLALRGDKALSREMVGRYAAENAGALRRAGLPVNDATVSLAHFLGAGGAIDVLKAAPDTPIRSIVGEMAYAANLTKAGTFVGGETAGDVRAWAGRRVGASVGDTSASDLRLAKEMQTELGRALDQQWAKVKADLDAGFRPSPALLGDLINAAALTGDADLLEEIGERVDRFEARTRLGRESMGDQQHAATALQQAGGEGMLPPGRAAWARDASAVVDATRNGLRDDPVSLVAQRFPEKFSAPPALDVTKSAPLQAGLRQRAAMVQFGAQLYGTAPLSALGPADLAAVQAVLDGPDPNAKARVVADLTQALPPDVRMATWAKLGQKGPAAALSSFAGAMMSADPEVANGILRGATALVAEPRYAPKEGTEGTALTDALDAALPAVAFGMGARTGEAGAYAVLREAVRSRYADLAATVGDTSGRMDERRLQRAVDDVTGGMLTHNGSPVIAPERGMSQRDFDGLLAGIGEADLAGVATVSGTAITSEYLRNSATLETIGQGRYLVRLNMDASRPAYAVRGGEPFVLDLRERTPLDPAEVYRQRGAERRENWRRRGIDAFGPGAPE